MIGIQAFIDDVPRDKEGKKELKWCYCWFHTNCFPLTLDVRICACSKGVPYQFLTFQQGYCRPKTFLQVTCCFRHHELQSNKQPPLGMWEGINFILPTSPAKNLWEIPTRNGSERTWMTFNDESRLDWRRWLVNNSWLAVVQCLRAKVN